MMRSSCTFAIFIALLVGASPLFACLPDSAMTQAEMECCKKMAGNCDMGGGKHKCCDMTVRHSTPATAIAKSSSHHDLTLSVVSRLGESIAFLPQIVERIQSASIQTSSSPPGPPTVLRI